MRKSLTAMAVTAALVVALILLAVLPTGCSRPAPKTSQSAGAQASTPVAKGPAPNSPTQPPAAASTPAAPEAASAGASPDMAFLMAARKNLRSYVQTVDISGHTAHHAVALKDGKPVHMRVDTGQPGQFVLVLLDKHVTYMVDTKRKTAIKVSMSPAAEADIEGAGKRLAKGRGAPTLSQLQAAHPKITSASLDGINCWKVETTDAKGNSSAAWVDKQYGLVRQYTADGKTTKVNYDKINAVPASEFEVPKGIKIIEQPHGMGMMNPHMPMGHPGTMGHMMPLKPHAPSKS